MAATVVHGVADEIPGACKDIDTVIADQSDFVEVVTKLKQWCASRADVRLRAVPESPSCRSG
jgi:RNA-splicing ligase RtcB